MRISNIGVPHPLEASNHPKAPYPKQAQSSHCEAAHYCVKQTERHRESGADSNTMCESWLMSQYFAR